jgi:ubiquinone/menaquinone biosynthesis C-methylase UbiE
MTSQNTMESAALAQLPQSARQMAGEYALATGAAAVRRLYLLHNVYSPVGRRVLLQAGITAGMHAADFGCGVGATTRMLAALVGLSGRVTAIDADWAQLEQAADLCKSRGLRNVSFLEADACKTKLPSASFDVAYCRFLLLHLPNPAECLREMHRILKPGGILVVEDGDLSTAGSVPPTALNACADLFGRLAPVRGVNYSIGRDLYHMVKNAGFPRPDIEIHQPAIARGEERFLLQWSVAEAGPAFVGAGLITRDELELTLEEMQAATQDPDVLVLAPSMSVVSARKAMPQV